MVCSSYNSRKNLPESVREATELQFAKFIKAFQAELLIVILANCIDSKTEQLVALTSNRIKSVAAGTTVQYETVTCMPTQSAYII